MIDDIKLNGGKLGCLALEKAIGVDLWENDCCVLNKVLIISKLSAVLLPLTHFSTIARIIPFSTLIHSFNNHGRCATTTIADSGQTNAGIVALQYIIQCGDNAGT